MQISILSVNILTKPNKSGKTYQVADLAFKNLTYAGKVEGKQLFGFGAQEPAFKVLSNAQPGDVFDITVVKNNAGYNDWVNAVKGTAGGTNDVGTANSGAKAATATATRSTYETPEERAKKQVYIIRQSSVSNAIAALSVGAKSPPKLNEVVDYAKGIERYVMDLQEAKQASDGFADVPDFPNEAE